MILFVFKSEARDCSSGQCNEYDDGRSFVSLLVIMLCHLIDQMDAVKKAAGWAKQQSAPILTLFKFKGWWVWAPLDSQGAVLFFPQAGGSPTCRTLAEDSNGSGLGEPQCPMRACRMRHTCTPPLNTEKNSPSEYKLLWAAGPGAS